MADVKKTAILQGSPGLAAVGVNAFEYLGNTSKLSLAITVDKKELPNYQGEGGNDDAFEQFKSGTISAAFRHVSIPMLELALGGTAVAVAAGAVPAEEHTVIEVGKLLMLDHMQDMSVTLTVTPSAGGDAFEEGTDYIRKRAGIIPIEGGGIAAEDVLSFAYTNAAHQRVQALLTTITERALMFDGINTRTGKPWLGIFHRVAWGVAKNIELIGEDFASFDVEGEILAADHITEVGKSRFYELLVGDL